MYDALYRGAAPRLASLGEWKPEWVSEHDPKGWAQWYKRYSGGRRIEGEDERQIKRWLGLKSRHGGPFVTQPTPRRGWALRNWAIDPAKLVPDQAEPINAMLDEHQRKAMQKFVQERAQAPVKAAELAPGIQLQDHQQRVSDRITDEDPRLLLYHGLGTGKSLSAIAAAEAAKKVHGGEYGVVVPASLKPNFQKEIKKFTRGSNPEILSYTGLARGKNFQEMPDTLVMDEAQRLKNPGSATTSAARRIASHAKRLLLLSGTPITNSPGDLASPMSMLRNETISIQKAVRSGIPPGFLWKLDQEFPLSREELAKLNSFMTGLRQVSLSTQPFRADKNPLKAFDQSSKLQEAMKRLRTTLDSDPRRKAIIYSNFIDAGIKPYAAALERENIPHGVFHGGIPLAARQQALNDYNAGKLRALLLGPAAAEGISTKGTSLIQLMDPYWHESRTQQARGRGLRFDSHQGLPEELKNVAVQRYLSGSEEPGLLGKLMGKRRQRTGDEVMSRLADEKEQLNEKFRQILRDVGTARPQEQEKAAAGPTPPPKKKKPGLPLLSAGLGGVGALGLGAAYGMASDQHAQSMRNALALHGTPLQPGETSLSRYGEILSPGANSTPFGLSIGNILSTARQHSETLKRFGINADPADKPGSFIDAEMHYDQFRKGPIAAYQHMTHPNKMMGEAKYNVGDKSYPEFMRGHFNNAWRKFINPQTGIDEMKGNAGWLEPHEIDTQKIPYDKQVQFMRDYEKTLPPEVQKIRQNAESHPDATAGLEKNLKSYMPVMRHALNARDKLKHVGLAAGGAGAGGALAHYLMRNRKDKNPLGYWASVLGGTGLGGAAGYYGGTAQGQQQMSGLIDQLKALANRA